VNIVNFLLDEGANPNVDAYLCHTPLFNAANMGIFDMVRLLVERGADPNFRTKGLYWKNHKRMSVLEIATECGHTEVADYISKHISE